MSLTLTEQLSAHLAGELTTTAICWRVEKRNGDLILGTDHDKDIELTSGGSPAGPRDGIYVAGSNISASDVKSSSDMSVDNMDVQGAIPIANELRLDIRVADIEGGLLRMAPVTVFFLNWRSPNDGHAILRRGYLGEIARDSDGSYKTEIRGLTQLLSQVIGDTFGSSCNVRRFGDQFCKFDLPAHTASGAITAVTNRRRFDGTVEPAGSPPMAAGDYRGGEFTFTSGDNEGYMREVKLDDNDDTLGHFSFWEPFPFEPDPGDTYTVAPGCDKSYERCIELGNVLNFRGYGIFMPGNGAMKKGPF